MIKGTIHSIVLCSLLMAAGSSLKAQEQKIGYVDTEYILSQMSEYEGIEQQLSSISKEWKNELEELEQEIEELQEDYQSKEILYTDEQKAKKKQEIQDKVEEREQYLDQKFGAEGEYFQKQKELLEPIQRKVFEAVNVVAQNQNFDFVFDRAQDTNMLYGGDEWNLNDEVLQELGITLNDASN